MVQLIKPTKVTTEIKDGVLDIQITLQLNINLNSNGVNVTTSNTEVEEIKKMRSISKDELPYVIQNFENTPKINFGKKVED